MADVVDNRKASITEIGKDEKWLQDWICSKPERLGLGPLTIEQKELNQFKSGGGRLDILGYSPQTNTYYEIEVMLNECDADHGFRCLDYWARERIARPNSIHYAVLVAENLQGRYKTVIETLPQFLPFIAIEIRTLLLSNPDGSNVATTYAEIVAQPDDLIMSTPIGAASPSAQRKQNPRDEKMWREAAGDSFVNDVQTMYTICEKQIGPSSLDYSANSYISLKKGRRAWLPMWPRVDGFYIHLPDDGSGTADEPSDRFRQVQTELKSIGIDVSWTYNYNGGSNPIGMSVHRSKIDNPVLINLLKASYELA